MYITVLVHERTKCIYLQFNYFLHHGISCSLVENLDWKVCFPHYLSLHFSLQAQVSLSLCPTSFWLWQWHTNRIVEEAFFQKYTEPGEGPSKIGGGGVCYTLVICSSMAYKPPQISSWITATYSFVSILLLIVNSYQNLSLALAVKKCWP